MSHTRVRLKKGSNNLKQLCVHDRNALYRGRCCTFVASEGDTPMVGIVLSFEENDAVKVARKQCEFTVPIQNIKF